MARQRRERETSHDNEVEMNFTSMLDLIFNILAFFVVTYNPPPAERNFDVNLPPPQAQARADATTTETSSPEEMEPADPFNQITITLRPGGPDGSPSEILIEGARVPAGTANLARAIKNRLAELGSTLDEPIEAATIVSSSGLKYRYLVETVEACTQAGLKKINFGGSD